MKTRVKMEVRMKVKLKLNDPYNQIPDLDSSSEELNEAAKAARSVMLLIRRRMTD